MKFMNMKRFGATVMAGALALSLAVPAFAAGNTTVIEGTYQDIPIAVQVPTAGTAQINPYGLPVSITKGDKTKVDIVGQQITSRPMSIKNQGTIPLAVDATLAVEPKGDAEIGVAASGTFTPTGKTMQVMLEVAGLNDRALALPSDDKTLEDLLIDRFVNDSSWSNAEELEAPAAPKGTKFAAITPASDTELAELGAATVDGKDITYGPKSIALVRLTGTLLEAPTKTDGGNTVADPWKETDGFTANVVFTFKPADKIRITVTAPTAAGAGATLSANPSSAWEGTEVTLTSTPPSANPTHVPTYSVVGTADATKVVTVTNGKFTMPDYPVTVSVTFAAP